MHAGKSILAILAATALVGLTSCIQHARLAEGTVPRGYPYDAPILRAVDIQVFRVGSRIEVVNHSAHSYSNVDLWLNERFVRRIDSLPAGESREFSLFEFVDEYQSAFRGGGLFAIERSEPVVKAEIEQQDGLIGLIVIPEDRG